MLFKKEGNEYKKMPEKHIKLEKEIQDIIEDNLETFFNLEFISSEFVIEDFRCDTFAIDHELKSFVVIEYKKQEDKGLFDQGLGYFSLLSSRQADFLAEYNEKTNSSLLKKSDIMWDESKLIFISTQFSKSQIQAAKFNINIELWKIKLYDNIVELNEITKSKKTRVPPKYNTTKPTITPYTEEQFKKKTNKNLWAIYQRYHDKIIKLPNVEKKMTKGNIIFKTLLNFIAFDFQKTKLNIHIAMNYKSMIDPKKLIKHIEDMKQWSCGNHVITISDDSNFDYVFNLIKQSHKSALDRTMSDAAIDAAKTRRINSK